MKRGRRLPYCLLFIALLFGAVILQRDGGAGFPKAQPRSNAQWAHLYAALPLSFEANQGQTDPSVSYLSRGRGFALFLTDHEAVLTLKNPSSAAGGQKPPDSAGALRLQLVGANPHAAVTGRDELPGKANYFLGSDPSKWRSNIPTYAKVRYESVYPGVDLVYYGTQGGELEYDFVVAPGADPKPIALGIEMPGRAPLRINAEGDLVVPLPNGDVQLHKPVVYQIDPAEASATSGSSAHTRHTSKVESHYALDAQNRVHFELGPYDHTRLLIIDPVLVYATYLGGSGGDVGYAITVDTNLDAYIAGVTNSSDFPTAGAAFQSAYGGNGDAFVTKINSYGTKLIFSTYLGGKGSDAATALAVSNGNIFVTGYTASTNFPIKSPVTNTEPFQMTYGGGASDAFVTELNATGNALVYSSYLGGSGADVGQGIAADSPGNAYVTGYTQSADFPHTANALQPSINGSQDAFVTKVNLTGEALLYSSFLGGSEADVAQAIQIDSTGDMYITGYTFSTDFPMQAPLQKTNAGGADAFVTEIKDDFSTLVFSTYLGGSADDRAYGIALDSTLNVYITGATASQNFPTTSGVPQTSLHGASNAFVSKLNPTGSSLLYSMYLGGSEVDQGNAIAVIPSGTNAGAAFVTGFTESTDFPTVEPVQALLGLSSITTYCGTAPCPNAFITQINPAGNALTYSTYLGGNSYNSGQGIALDDTGDPYITGSTSSTNFPAIWGASYKQTLTGTAGNAFVAKIDPANEPNISIVPASLNFGNETLNVTSALQQVTIVNPSTETLNISSIVVGNVGTSSTVFTESDNCVGNLSGGGDSCTMNVAFTPNTTGSVSDEITITDNAAGVTGSLQYVNLTGFGSTVATAATVQPPSLSFNSTNVGSVSAPQNVTITNTGTEPLNITQFSTGTTGDFAETNNCGALQNTLAENQSCTISVTFSPKASGTRTALLAITDNATGSPQTVALTGIGAAEFTLTSPPPSTQYENPALIGSTQTTLPIVAEGPSGFNGAITLACSAGTTCEFSTNPVYVGQSVTMTVSNLTTTLSNPYIFTVTGTSGSQTTSVQINLGFEDFTLTVTPSIDTIEAGTTASYSVIVNPLYGFNQQVQLQCYTGMPPDSSCTFTPNATPTPNGGPVSVTLSIGTAKYIAPLTNTPPRFPGGKLPPLIFGVLCLAGLTSLALGNRRRARHGWLSSGWLGVRLATLSLILALNLAMVACRSSVLVISGTTIGNYTITISGTLVNNTSVQRVATMALAVTSSNPI
jgi:hypothetical protein